MVILTKLNGELFTLNVDLIETMFQSPDTTIRLLNGNLYIVKEPMTEIIEKTIRFKKEIYAKFKDGTELKEKASY